MSRILLVDDDKNIRLLVRAALAAPDSSTEPGHEIFEAPDGAIALDAVRSRQFDLVILDLNMPVLDGMNFLQQLRDEPLPLKLKAPRVIVLTAYGSISAAVRATRIGALDFLEKPITPAQLRTCVEAVLAQPEPAVAPAAGRPVATSSGFDGVLARVRLALRASDVATAEELLLRAADFGQNVASYYNLVGLIYEIRGQIRLARKFYGKAMGAAGSSGAYPPAEHNLRRLYELDRFRKTDLAPALGDEDPAHATKEQHP
jgi:DNA-binding response OmpR family regulator